MDGLDGELLARMPLAEAVLLVWRYIADEEQLQAVFEAHRGRCYEDIIRFSVMVQLIADALLEHEGSGNQSFSRARESGALTATMSLDRRLSDRRYSWHLLRHLLRHF